MEQHSFFIEVTRAAKEQRLGIFFHNQDGPLGGKLHVVNVVKEGGILGKRNHLVRDHQPWDVVQSGDILTMVAASSQPHAMLGDIPYS